MLRRLAPHATLSPKWIRRRFHYAEILRFANAPQISSGPPLYLEIGLGRVAASAILSWQWRLPQAALRNPVVDPGVDVRDDHRGRFPEQVDAVREIPAASSKIGELIG